MADLDFRLNRDVLTIAESARCALLSAGLDLDADGALTLNIEPEVVQDAIIADINTGAQCVVTNVIDFCPSALRKMNALKEAEHLSNISIEMTQNMRVQHPLVRVFPSKLPLDYNNKNSLNEHCDEYKFIAKLFAGKPVDGYLLHGFTNETELKCALVGLRKVSAKTLIFDKSNFRESEIIAADYQPASSKIAIFDYEKMAHIDELLDTAIQKAETGAQFLLVNNANPSKTAAICALTKGWPVQ